MKYDFQMREGKVLILQDDLTVTVVETEERNFPVKKLQEAETKEEIQSILEAEFTVAYVRSQAERVFRNYPQTMGKFEDAVIRKAKEIRKLDCNSYFAKRINELLDEIEAMTDAAQRLT